MDAIEISKENGGYDISAYVNGERKQTVWKHTQSDALRAAMLMADFYTDANGQRLTIVKNF